MSDDPPDHLLIKLRIRTAYMTGQVDAAMANLHQSARWQPDGELSARFADLSLQLARLVSETGKLSAALRPREEAEEAAASVTETELAKVICPIPWENLSGHRKEMWLGSAGAALNRYHVTRKADR